MPGPRGPMGGPGGPRGPMGGPGGSMGGPGRGSRTTYINGRAINNVAQPAGGKSQAPTSGPVGSLAVFTENIRRNMKYSVKRNKVLKGSLIGIRYHLTNGLHMGSFKRKIAAADKALEKGKITEEQCAIRKMQAAGTYYTYLRKIGYYEDKDVAANMYLFANRIGVDYEDTTFSRTR